MLLAILRGIVYRGLANPVPVLSKPDNNYQPLDTLPRRVAKVFFHIRADIATRNHSPELGIGFRINHVVSPAGL